MIGDDGIIYTGSLDGHLHAINPDGTRKWILSIGWVDSSPLIGNDGTIYVGTFEGYIYGINQDGSKKWSYEIGRPAERSSPVMGNDGVIYVGSEDSYLYAIKTSSIGPADSPWPMFGQNAQRTGRAPSPVPDKIQINAVSKSDSPFTISFESKSGSTYTIEVSHNLKQWSEIGEVQGTGSSVKFTDPRLPIVPFERNYFRVKLVE